MQSLGDRMKRYEACYDQTLLPNSCVFVRVDGRAFHTYTRHKAFGERKNGSPFVHLLHTAMVEAADSTRQEMSGFKLLFTQSDECTFVITDFDSYHTEPWFGGRLNKVVSITASAYTAYFNRFMSQVLPDLPVPAMFDARAYVVPFEDAPNVFVWRQRDWERNSLSMLAQHHFSHSKLQGKSSADMHEMLHQIGVNWAELDPWQKNGTYIDRAGLSYNERLSYNQIKQALTPFEVDDAD